MDKMQLLYHDEAKAKNSYVINSCGMDSIPVDIGVLHYMKNFDGMSLKNFILNHSTNFSPILYTFLSGQVNYVESYMRISNNTNTYVSNFQNISSILKYFR